MFHKSFYNNEKRNLEPDLISGFFSAIFSFSHSLLNKNPEVLEISYIKIIFKETEDYIFSAVVDENESIPQVIKNLEKISEKFLEIFAEILEDWNSDRTIFSIFNETIEKILVENDIKRMVFLENITEIKDLIEIGKIHGILIFTSTAELMFSNIVDDKLNQFLVKIIEAGELIKYKFTPMIFNNENYNIFIEDLPNSLIIAILMDQDVSIIKAQKIYDFIFEKLKDRDFEL